MAQRPDPRNAPTNRWSTSIRSLILYQTESNLDMDGSFNQSRFFIQGGVTRSMENRKSISISTDYTMDAYSFAGETGFSGRHPWGTIHSLNLSLPFHWAMDDALSLFLIPTVRSHLESGARFQDAISGGGIAGFSYRISDRLSIGPGLGVISQIEESASIFPVLLINWKITETVSLETGRGVGASLGPGLNVVWHFSPQWRFSVGGRYEKQRFRLDEDGKVPGGVGEHQSFPVYAVVSYSIGSTSELAFSIGTNFDGTLSLENSEGSQIEKSRYDPTPFFALAFQMRF